jgi:predicted HD phosphohydrolase
MEKMHFTRMDEGTKEDFALLEKVHERTLQELPDRLYALLNDVGKDNFYNISRKEHCLQAATRALRDNRDEEYIVVTLFHDICESLGPFNHGEVIAAILKPFISRNNYWMLCKHGLFQTYYYAKFLDLDPNERDEFKSDPAYAQTVEFCAKYDEVSFDPNYKSEPLSTFDPMVRRVLNKRWTPPGAPADPKAA